MSRSGCLRDRGELLDGRAPSERWREALAVVVIARRPCGKNGQPVRAPWALR